MQPLLLSGSKISPSFQSKTSYQLATSTYSLLLASGNSQWSAFYLYAFIYSSYFILIELYNMKSLVSVFHIRYYFGGLSILQYVSVLHSFYSWIIVYVYTKICLYILYFMDIWAVFTFWLLWIVLSWAHINI